MFIMILFSFQCAVKCVIFTGRKPFMLMHMIAGILVLLVLSKTVNHIVFLGDHVDENTPESQNYKMRDFLLLLLLLIFINY